MVKPRYKDIQAIIDKKNSSRLFTDREGLIKAFHEAFAYKKLKQHKVLVYYGIGGIGKTRLIRELHGKVKKESNVITPDEILDFEDEIIRIPDNFLIRLCNSLSRRNGIKFSIFNIVYALYWTRAYPKIPLKEDHLPFLEEGDLIGDIAHAIADLPFIDVVFKIGKFCERLEKEIFEWWLTHGRDDFTKLAEIRYPKDILSILPKYFADDLRRHMEKSGKKAVIFVDTYEALSQGIDDEGKVFQNEEWVREMIAHLPEVLWIIGGREKINWSEREDDWQECLEQHLIGNLAHTDAKKFLNNYGIHEEDIVASISKASDGVPFYLDLAVDIYYEIIDKRYPQVTDFQVTENIVFFELLMRHLQKHEREMLKMLSVPNFLDYGVFDLLRKTFVPNYNASDYWKLMRFSFIDGHGESKRMHTLMQKSLRSHLKSQGPELLKEIHRTLFFYYNQKLNNIIIRNITADCMISFREAYYHGKSTYSPDDIFRWYKDASRVFIEAAQYPLIISVLSDLLVLLKKRFGSHHQFIADALNNLAFIFWRQGRYAEAENLCEQSLKIIEEKAYPDNSLLGDIYFHLAVVYHEKANYDRAKIYYENALRIREQILGAEDLSVAEPLTALGFLFYERGEYKEAFDAFNKALQIRKEKLGEDHIVTTITLNGLAVLQRALGQQSEAESLFRKILKIRCKALGLSHPDVAQTFYNLAKVWSDRGNLERAEKFFLRAKKIEEKVIGTDYPYLATTLNELANLYTKKGEYEKAETFYKEALEIRRKRLSDDHPYIATTLHDLGSLYFKRGKFDLAEQAFKHALEIRSRKLSAGHPHIASTLANLGFLYLKEARTVEAEQLFIKALEIIEEKFGPNHPMAVEIRSRRASHSGD